MENSSTQLPAEWKQKIENEAEYKASLQFHKKYSHDQWTACVITYRQGATEYATMLHQSQQEIRELRQWKSEATELLNPIWDYADEVIGVKAGERKTNAVINHVTRCRRLLAKVLDRHEAGLLPDRLLYNEIKTFLDGTK